MRRVVSGILLIGALLLLATRPAGWAQPYDHLHCFKVKDAAAKASYSADLTSNDPTFVVAPGCTIKSPATLLCVDVRKTNVAPAPPGALPGSAAQKYLCYKVKCAKIEPVVTLEDQFGSHSLQVKGSKLLCAPVIPPCTDADGDGFCAQTNDCDDANAQVNPSEPEVCDGLDNDCDGQPDDGNPGGGAACSTGLPGVCAPGTTSCTAGALVCNQTNQPSTEVCDGVDNDCDGTTDEGCTCAPGTSDCDANPGNGCEVQHVGYSNSPPGEFLGTFDADSADGFVCPSSGCDFQLSRTGTQGRYFTINLHEGSSCCAYIGARFELIVPSGADYDLYVTGNACFANPAFSSTNAGNDVISVWCNDDCSSADDSFTANVEVRYHGGASCSPWTLNVYRREC
jgi:hypothetical protein